MLRVDLNCDMGESFGAYRIGADDEVLPFVTSANVACGFHGGDPAAMRRTIAETLDISVDRVSVKASTRDRLGEIGRGEAIAAIAVALLEERPAR